MALEEYEVFLSFRGPDTREGFTNVLYNYLQDVRVRTFIDSEDLHVGETIRFELLDRIRKSKISIAIFSQGYASSKWCLNELVEMVRMARCVECRKRETHIPISNCKNCNKRNCGHKIIRIFYDVTPDDVKLKTNVYEQFFADHNNNHKSETVKQWRDVLKDVGGLKGLELATDGKGLQGDFARIIVNKVLQKLKKSEVQLPEILVGMEHHKEKLEGFLNLDTYRVRILGIYGMGGIGKTTIAKVIYNNLCKRYELCCFVEKFEKLSRDPNYLLHIQKQLVSNFSRGGYPEICSVEQGKEHVKRLISGNKFLLVLDDVDKVSHFNDFFGNCNLVASKRGSTIIVTTRNMEVLDWLKERYKSDSVFEIYELPLLDSKESLTLFSKFAFSSDLPPKSSATISMQIVKIASGLPLALKDTALSCGNQGECNAILRKIEKFPHGSVLENLSRSFETLDGQQRDIFLDTACLFIGHDSIITSYMWEDCGLIPEDNVKTNVKRSLMKINGANSLWMHPQLRDVGREIVRKEDEHNAGKRSRLWIREEALDVFDRRMGTDKVLAICLSFTTEELESRSDSISIEDFGELRNLRFLIAGSINFEGHFQYLFSNLRWLQWKPLGNGSPSNCELKNLVILDLSESQIMDNWDGWIQIKRSKKLKVLNLSKCNNLSTAPDFSTFRLERLILASCRRLGNIELCTINLQNLRYLNLSDCSFLSRTFDFSQLRNLEYLDVHSCTQLTSLQGFDSLMELQYLDTSDCPKLESLPDLSRLQKLKTLRIANCNKLIQILGLNMLISLEHLDIHGCVNVCNVPNISNMTLLKEVLLSGCTINVAEVKGIWELESLETLDMSWCTSVERMEEQILNLSKLKRLKILKLAGFGNFNQIQGLQELECLEELNINGWSKIQNLPDLSNLKKLKEIKAYNCQNLYEIRGVERLESLELLVTGGPALQTLPNLPNVTKKRKFQCSS